IGPGEVVALAGPSGCGKSTVLGVLLGFIRPDAGQVRVGGADPATLGPQAWRAAPAPVPPGPPPFARPRPPPTRPGAPRGRGAARGGWGGPGAGAPAAAAAGLADPDLDPPVGGRGTGLPTGQRRRVALARALLRCAGLPAPVLLLDEPTAGVDPETEAVILAA